MLLQRLAKL